MREHNHKYRSHEDRRYANALMGKNAMGADEAQAFDAAVEIIQRLPAFVCERRLALEAMEVLAAAKHRTESRRRSDRRTDGKRRKLVGAKLPIEVAEEIQLLADLQGVSVYRFVVDALDAARRKARKKYGGDPETVLQVRPRSACVVMALPCRQNSYAIE